jgi:hypothetical protein
MWFIRSVVTFASRKRHYSTQANEKAGLIAYSSNLRPA